MGYTLSAAIERSRTTASASAGRLCGFAVNHMQSMSIKLGDKVRHPARLEWGVGTVTRTEVFTTESVPDLRLWVKFPAIGLRTLIASVAKLEVMESAESDQGVYARPTLAQVEASRGGLAADTGYRKAEDLMTGLPLDATDPFVGLKTQLERTLKLYRFDGSPAKLIDWAVAQSALDDPLTRFNRQELEVFYKRWLFNLDAHLVRLMQDARREGTLLDTAARNAPPLGQQTVQRLRTRMR